MDREKFQQKALKQTKQKKSKSAEFLMVKEDGGAMEGTGNPAFNMSSPDLSAQQSSEKKVIRHDTRDRTLAAHQQKCRLQASAEPKGNEYSRNYFDPLMDEEINPRQRGMEVSQEGELELNDSIVAGTLSSEDPASSRKNLEHYKKDSEAISADSEEIERNTQKNVILPGSSSLEQDLTFDGEGLGEYIPMSCLKSNRTFEKTTSQGIIADPNVCEAGGIAKLGTLPEVTHPSKGAVWPWPCWKVEQSRSPQPLQIQMKCIRGLKNKVPQGSYLLKVSLLGQPGGRVLQWNPEEQLKTRTRPVRHGGNFYDVGLFFHESLYVVLPPKKDVKLGMAFLFELFLLRGKYTYLHQVVGWATFPLYDSSMDVVEGKFKCPLLRGHYDQKVDSFKKTEDLICLDLDHWLCNLYFQEKPTAWKTGETEDYSQDTSYLEELEKHKFSVCRSSAAANAASGEFFKHLCFVLVSVCSELEFAQWQSQGFWYIILLMASLWFLRLYLHYLSQWFFLQAISTPVTKFRFSPLTVELCYPASSLHIAEEMLVVVVGPFMLNAVVLPLVLVRWGCQLLFAFCPDVLSKLIITMGLWAVLDPLAVFTVDTVLGRLTQREETPVADAAKLYWMFERTMQSGILGVMLTVLLYVLLFIISCLILYVYCLRLHNDSWILDIFQRIHSEESKFFIPYDLEISNQELSYIIKRSEQWRGLNGERRKVAVYDYIWKRHGVQSSISSCDLQQHDDISVTALGPGGITSHVAVYTVYPSGFQELYRHFLRLPSGAIVEVFGDIGGLTIIPIELVTAIQKQLSEIDGTLGDSPDIKSTEKKKNL